VVTTTFASPLGEILLAADGRGLTGLWFEGQEHFGSTLLREDSEHVEGVDAVSGTGGMSSVSPANGAASSVLERSWAWLNAYFAGQEPRFTPPLHMIGTAFQREVWFELLSIPRGEVATYGEIAQRVAARHRVPGNEAPVVSPRAVGAAVARNPISIIVPCHRVVAADGSLNGYAGGLDRKEWLLRLEGAYEE
jgi:methylated-DNA-[protein]-cysteine S-methyltransferase